MSDQERIAARIAGRKAAEEVKGLLSWPDNYGADYADAFCETMRKLLPRRRADVETLTPVTRLGSTQLEFGMHRGLKFDEAPLEYLQWLCGAQEDFLKVLRLYLKHPDLERHRI